MPFLVDEQWWCLPWGLCWERSWGHTRLCQKNNKYNNINKNNKIPDWLVVSAMGTRRDVASCMLRTSILIIVCRHCVCCDNAHLNCSSTYYYLWVIVSALIASIKFFNFIFRPQYGGKFCPGSSRIYQLCNINPCNENGLDFRAQQCAEYNSKPFRGWFYQWKPYTKVEGNLVSITFK